MNDVILIGRISTDLELKEITGDKKLVNFNIAINRQGTKDKTDFIPCTCFNEIAENLVKYQKKGSLIAVKGSIRQNEYTDKEGNKRYSLNVIASRIQYLESTNKENKEYNTYLKANSEAIDDSDIPF